MNTRIAKAVLVAAAVSAAAVFPASAADPEPQAEISSDCRAVVVKRASDKEAITVPVLDRCGNPVVGPPKIRRLGFVKGDLVATYGKHCWATISMKTLEVVCSGCD